jgi:hypothetical protein
VTKPITIGSLFLVLLVACSNSTPGEQKVITPERKYGFIIDSTVRQEVLKNIDTAGRAFNSATVIMNYFQDDKPKDVLYINGEHVPLAAMSRKVDDSINIMIASLFFTNKGLFYIRVIGDSAYVSFIWGPQHATESFKLDRNDSSYTHLINMPCKFYLVLDKKKYNPGEPVFGYVDASTGVFYRKVESSDTKDSLAFRGWFSTTQN